MSGTGRHATLPLGAVRTDDGDVVVPESRRADGSVRKTIRIRQGYVPQDEVPKYKPIGQRMREQQAKQSKADTETLAEGLHTLSLQTSRADKPSVGVAHGNTEPSRRRPQSPPAARAPSASPSAAASSSARDLKAELSTLNKSLREIAKLEAFAAAAARGDDGSRPLTAAQQQKTQRKSKLEARREEIIALLDDDRKTTRSTPTPTTTAATKPTTLRVVEL